MTLETLQKKRSSVVLLHPTSLPSSRGDADGCLGSDAYKFVDFLAAANVGWWQVLPLGPTHEDLSPYNGISAFAGNPSLISFADFRELCGQRAPSDIPLASLSDNKLQLIETSQAFHRQGSESLNTQYRHFKESQYYWLEDYALFTNLRTEQRGKPWSAWPKPLRVREASALSAARERLDAEIELSRFEQFVFYYQWQKLRSYAREKNVSLIGDMPFFVAYDSAEVWAQPQFFDLDEDGYPKTVAGVPPDYFSATGQLWGSPQYDWAAMEESGFSWWKQRVGHLLDCFDVLRIDHFRGLESVWEIAASESTAVNGKWLKVPGRKLLSVLEAEFPNLPCIAEDLGFITEEVQLLRDDFGLPGIKVLQFAFDSDASNPYLPHNHTSNCVAYTGTHDNDTVMGWYQSLDHDARQKFYSYLGYPQEEMPWLLIRCVMASVASLAVIPMQDLLGLDSDSRMNTPGTLTEYNWKFRFEWSQVPEDLPNRLSELLKLYGRN